MELKIEKLKSARTVATAVIDAEARAKAEVRALERLANQVEIKGFRVGKAPADAVRARVGEEAITEETVRVLLPDVVKEALEKSGAKPIIRPNATVLKLDPLTVSVAFVEKPEASLKKAGSIAVEKKPTEVTNEEIESFVKKVLMQDKVETPVAREAKTGDSVRIAMNTKEKGVEVKELTVGNYALVLGAEELLPEIETHLKGMKKDEKKTVDVSFKKDHEIPGIRGKKLNVELTVKEVSEVKLPELTADYLKGRLKTERSPEQFRTDIKDMLQNQKLNAEMQRREDELYEKVRTATSVDLAVELVDSELRLMIDDLQNRIKGSGATPEEWLKSTGKEWKQVVDEMTGIAKDRLTLRYGMDKLAEEKKVAPTDAEIQKSVSEVVAHAEQDGQKIPAEEAKPGGGLYESVKFDLMMRGLVDMMIK